MRRRLRRRAGRDVVRSGASPCSRRGCQSTHARLAARIPRPSEGSPRGPLSSHGGGPESSARWVHPSVACRRVALAPSETRWCHAHPAAASPQAASPGTALPWRWAGARFAPQAPGPWMHEAPVRRVFSPPRSAWLGSDRSLRRTARTACVAWEEARHRARRLRETGPSPVERRSAQVPDPCSAAPRAPPCAGETLRCAAQHPNRSQARAYSTAGYPDLLQARDARSTRGEA